MDGVAQVEDDASHELGTLAAGKRKRVLTEGRKKQNREAQRRFRERKKNALNSDGPATDVSQIAALQASQEVENINSLNASELPLDGNLGPPTFDNHPDFGLSAGDTSLSIALDNDVANPWIAAFADRTRENLSVPSPYVNYLQLHKLNFYAARMQNAMHIGIPRRLAEVDKTLSPWYWDTQFSLLFLHAYPPDYSNVLLNPPEVDRGQLFPARFGHFPQPLRNQRCFAINNNVNEDLSPTPLQRSKPHALYIDMIPFPIFRDRVITLLDLSPPAFDEDELRQDMENDGLLVWGGARAERSVRDKRNWECAKWFLEKWKILVAGSGMDEQSRWWRQMRGEDDSDDEL